jgi:hypothetical protein
MLPPIFYHCVGHSDEGLVGGMLYGVGVIVNVLDLITHHPLLCMWW